MNLNPVLQTLTTFPGWLKQRAQGMFNLNDPRWGRDEDKPSSNDVKPETPGDDRQPPRPPNRPQGQGPNQGPPDLDELWRDFNRKLSGLFGGTKNGGNRGGFGGGGNGGGFQPDMKSAGIGVGLIASVVVLIWLGTGFFIVQEGQQAVITQFGKYHSTVGAGFNWRLPYPIQRHEIIVVTQIRSVDVGRDVIIKATGLRDSAMLTEDENIVEIKFAVQYRLSDARAYLFESKDPTAAVVQAAETAVREVVGKMKMDMALAEERDQIGPRVRILMQTILDRYKVGVDVVGINLQQSGVRPPEQVQAAFDDVLKAGQERERAKNEAQAYANDVIPRAVGSASRLKEESEAYKARIIAQAEGHNPGQPIIGAPPVYAFEHHQTEQCEWVPNTFLDITDVWDTKFKAIECMAGQEHLWEYYTRVAQQRGAQAARNSDKKITWGEGFQSVFPHVVESLA